MWVVVWLIAAKLHSHHPGHFNPNQVYAVCTEKKAGPKKRRVKRVCVCVSCVRPLQNGLPFSWPARPQRKDSHDTTAHRLEPRTGHRGRGARATRHARLGHKSVCAETRVQTKRGTHANQNRAAAASFPSFRASCASFPSCVPSSPPSTACASWRHSPRSRRCCCRPAGLKGR